MGKPPSQGKLKGQGMAMGPLGGRNGDSKWFVKNQRTGKGGKKKKSAVEKVLGPRQTENTKKGVAMAMFTKHWKGMIRCGFEKKLERPPENLCAEAGKAWYNSHGGGQEG